MDNNCFPIIENDQLKSKGSVGLLSPYGGMQISNMVQMFIIVPIATRL